MPKGIYKRTPEMIRKVLNSVKLAQKKSKENYSPTYYKCKLCGEKFTDTPSAKRIFCSRECKERWTSMEPERHPAYKGESGNSTTIHKWIKRKRGRPESCEWCGVTPTRGSDGRSLIHWANLSGKYLRDIGDWAALCIKCHFKYDKPYLKRKRKKDGKFA